MHRALGALGALVAASCAAPAEELSAAPEAGPQGDCLADPLQLAQRNRIDLERLGLYFSQARFVAQIEPPARASNGYEAELTIGTVHFGPRFLQGVKTKIHLDEGEVRFFQFPGEFLVGMTGNPFPLRDRAGGLSQWDTKRALLESQQLPEVSDVLGYDAAQTPFVAVVQVEARDAARTQLRVLETLAGDLPARFLLNWSDELYDAPFPRPGEERFIASLNTLAEYDGLFIGSLVDFRPATEEALAAARKAIAAPAPPLDAAPLRSYREQQLLSWTVHRAEGVLTTEIAGLAGECCTGAGGTYVDARVLDRLRGATPHDRVTLGGHAYYGPEKCGDRLIFALDEIPAEGPLPREKLSCQPDAWIFEPRAVPRIRASMESTAENLARAREWISSAEPKYLLSSSERRPGAANALALWSSRASVAQALMVGTPAELEVVAARVDGDETFVEISTNFTTEHFEHLVPLRGHLSFRCGDPRLSQVGSKWQAMLVSNGGERPSSAAELDASGVFLVPGVLFPPMEHLTAIYDPLYALRFSMD